ncbi:hypothetical protein CAP38_07170 [Hydrogenophaga sp. IBVHS2]|nr:hypothetical protein CAP38_07170 [Hydrogenophaga sp. IBVHS2]
MAELFLMTLQHHLHASNLGTQGQPCRLHLGQFVVATGACGSGCQGFFGGPHLMGGGAKLGEFSRHRRESVDVQGQPVQKGRVEQTRA